MREHMGLFRGKRLDNGEWAEGNLVHITLSPIQDWWEITTGRYDAMGHMVSHKIDPDTVGECTGLEDKNGKLIFEGDILEQAYLGEKHRYTVVYSRETFAWGQKNKDGLTGRLAKGIGTLEIIGNIHDNPELLEGAIEKK